MDYELMMNGNVKIGQKARILMLQQLLEKLN